MSGAHWQKLWQLVKRELQQLIICYSQPYPLRSTLWLSESALRYILERPSHQSAFTTIGGSSDLPWSQGPWRQCNGYGRVLAKSPRLSIPSSGSWKSDWTTIFHRKTWLLSTLKLLGSPRQRAHLAKMLRGVPRDLPHPGSRIACWKKTKPHPMSKGFGYRSTSLVRHDIDQCLKFHH